MVNLNIPRASFHDQFWPPLKNARHGGTPCSNRGKLCVRRGTTIVTSGGTGGTGPNCCPVASRAPQGEGAFRGSHAAGQHHRRQAITVSDASILQPAASMVGHGGLQWAHHGEKLMDFIMV